MDKYEAHINGQGGHEHPHADHRTFEECAEAVYEHSRLAMPPGTLLTLVHKETASVRYYISTTHGLKRLSAKDAAEHMTHEGWVLPTETLTEKARWIAYLRDLDALVRPRFSAEEWAKLFRRTDTPAQAALKLVS